MGVLKHTSVDYDYGPGVTSTKRAAFYLLVILVYMLSFGRALPSPHNNSDSVKPGLTAGWDFKEASLHPYLEYLITNENEATKIDPAGQWQRIPPSVAVSGDGSLSLGFENRTVWVRFKIRNPGKKKKSVYLLQKFAPLDHVTLFGVNRSKAKAWLKTKSKKGYSKPKVRHRKTYREIITLGDAHPLKQLQVPHRFPVIPLELTGRKTSEYLLRLKSSGLMVIDLQMVSPEFFQKTAKKEFGYLVFYYGIMAVLIVYNLSLALFTRRLEYLYYTLFTSALVFYCATVIGHSFEYLWPDSPNFNNQAVALALAGAGAFAAGFMWEFLDLKNFGPAYRWFFLSLILVSLGAIATNFLVSYHFALVLLTFFGVAGSGAATFATIRLVINRHRPAYFFTLSMITLLAGGSLYTMRVYGIAFPLSEFGFHFGTALSSVLLSVGLADRINQMRSELATLNKGLELRVKERTEELQQSLNDVSKLKMQQDGDYYLTSLLVEPLQTPGRINSSSIEVDYINEPYKHFVFKDRNHTIGGDYCNADKVIIGGQSYVFFTNADAMGKSIQGAGGALVLGSYIKSELGKAAFGKGTGSLPELWLRRVFLDLQTIFLAFEGSMLVSLIAGLVCERSGMLYYFNAEHPFPILLRNSKARLLMAKQHLYKIGVAQSDLTLSIQTFVLQKDDVFVIASDGRDEVVLKASPQKGVNDDETLFLQYVEQGKGNPQKIAGHLRNDAIIRDDLTILTVRWKTSLGDTGTVAHTQFIDRKGFLEGRINFYRNKKNTRRLLACYLLMQRYYPTEKRNLNKIAHCYAKLADYNRAYDYAFAQYLRDNTHGANNALLGHICTKLQLLEKADYFKNLI